MARQAEDLTSSSPVVPISEPASGTSFDDWLREVDGDVPVALDVQAAEILRELRERGEA